MRLKLGSAAVLLSLLLLLPAVASAATATPAAVEASWLDGDFASWNSPGMAIPAAPAVQGNDDPRCAEQERPAETAQDKALAAQGWRLFRPYERGWDITLVWGLAGYDGMCRPWGYQVFLFVGDDFAGAIAPEPIYSRTDGAADDATFYFKDQVTAEFRRYTADDPLCCPSSSVAVDYTIDVTAGGPVLTPHKPQG